MSITAFVLCKFFTQYDEIYINHQMDIKLKCMLSLQIGKFVSYFFPFIGYLPQIDQKMSR